MPKKKSQHKKKKAQSRHKQVELVRKQVGLLVTKELQAAIDACKEEVARIAQECRERNVKFRDYDFDLDDDWKRCVYGLKYDTYRNSINARRITEIFESPKFFNANGAAESSAIIQGQLGDCYFLAALGTVCCIPGLIEKICVARDEEVGVYGFIFFQDDGWVRVIIDDLLATSTPRSFDSLPDYKQSLFCEDRRLFQEVQQKGSQHLIYAKSGSNGETWVPLIEKAYAKLYGNYQHLEAGETFAAIEDLSGGVSTVFNSKDILDTDRFWREEFLKVNQDRLLSAAFFGTEDRIQGLIPSHAYSVLKAVEWKGKRFVVVRNPWGESEWTGAWSDGSKEWTSEWVGALKELNHVFGNDGQFVMEYKDFLAYFEQIGRTFLFDESWVLVSEWMKIDIPNVPEVANFGDLTYRLTVPEKTKAIISISEINNRAFSSMPQGPEFDFQYAIVRHGDTHPLMVTPKSASSRLTLELELEPGLYLIYVKIEHGWYLESYDAGTCNVDSSSIQTRIVTNVMASKVRSLSMVKNWETSLKPKLFPKSLQEVIEEDLAAESKATHEEPLPSNIEEKSDATVVPDASKVDEAPTTNGSVPTTIDCEQPGTSPDETLQPVPVQAAERNGEVASSNDAKSTTDITQNAEESSSTDKSTLPSVLHAADEPPPSAPPLAAYQLVLIFVLTSLVLPPLDLLARLSLYLIGSKTEPPQVDNVIVNDPMEANESVVEDRRDDYQEPPSYVQPLPIPVQHTGHSSVTATEPEHWHTLYKDSTSAVFLGLRVYTQTKEPCSIVGKVRK